VLHPLGKRSLCQTVSKLGWHTPSWLLTSEVEAAIGHHGLAGSFRFDFRLLIQTMKTIEAELESERVRLVFWFDS